MKQPACERKASSSSSRHCSVLSSFFLFHHQANLYSPSANLPTLIYNLRSFTIASNRSLTQSSSSICCPRTQRPSHSLPLLAPLVSPLRTHRSRMSNLNILSLSLTPSIYHAGAILPPEVLDSAALPPISLASHSLRLPPSSAIPSLVSLSVLTTQLLSASYRPLP